jgi:hypothetical protein
MYSSYLCTPICLHNVVHKNTDKLQYYNTTCTSVFHNRRSAANLYWSEKLLRKNIAIFVKLIGKGDSNDKKLCQKEEQSH